MQNPQTPQSTDNDTDHRISDLVKCIRDTKHEIEQRESELIQLRQELGALLEQRGANWSDDEGYARLVSEGTRISYDTQALDELIIHDPLRYGWLKDYRRESKVSSRVQVQ